MCLVFAVLWNIFCARSLSQCTRDKGKSSSSCHRAYVGGEECALIFLNTILIEKGKHTQPHHSEGCWAIGYAGAGRVPEKSLKNEEVLTQQGERGGIRSIPSVRALLGKEVTQRAHRKPHLPSERCSTPGNSQRSLLYRMKEYDQIGTSQKFL